MTESLTKEERIQLSTQWPPDTKLFLKLLRVHDELNSGYDRMCLAVLRADEMLKVATSQVTQLEGQLMDSYNDNRDLRAENRRLVMDGESMDLTPDAVSILESSGYPVGGS